METRFRKIVSMLFITAFFISMTYITYQVIPQVPQLIPPVSANLPTPSSSTVGSLTSAPIQFTETSSYIKLNFTMFVVEFHKGTTGYNKIYDRFGNVLVYDDRIILEYYKPDPESPEWKQRGTPTGIGWSQVSEHHYTVTRFYTDYLGTTYNITYVVKSDAPMKITINLKSGKTDQYRLAWYPSGITKLPYSERENRVIFGDEGTVYGWIAFDWNDVYQTFGNITQTSYEDVADGKKANIYFNIGTINAGQTVTLDPSTVGTTANSYATAYPFQKKSFKTNSRFFAFYVVYESYVVWAHSPDGSTWTNTTKYLPTNSPTSYTYPNATSWSAPGYAYADDSNYAYVQSAKPSVQEWYRGYGFNIPSGAGIDSVRVRLDAWGGNEEIHIKASKNGGSSWLTNEWYTQLTTSEATYWADITSWTSWTPADFNNNNIWIAVWAYTVGGASQVNLDWIPIEVRYWYPDQRSGRCAYGDEFSIFYNGTHVFQSNFYLANYDLYFRMGTANADGTINWNTERTILDGTSTNYYRFPMIVVDSGGYTWIGILHYDGTNFFPKVLKNSKRDGTWTTDTGFPYLVKDNPTSNSQWKVLIVPLTNLKVYVIYSYPGAGAYGKLYNSGWQAEEGNLCSYVLEHSNYMTATNQSDDVHFAYLRQTTYQIRYNKRIYGVGWEGDVGIFLGVLSTSAPVMSIATPTNDVYVFYASGPFIYYKKRTTSGWQDLVEWINESPDTIFNDRLTCFYKSYDDKIGVLYLKTITPYTVRFAFLDVSVAGYALNLRVRDSDLTDNIQGGFVYKDSDVKISDANGWANWTGQTGTVQIKVKYYGFWVNGTFSVVMDSDKTINVKCNLYDVTITVQENVQSAYLVQANVTVFNATSTSGNKIKSGTTGSNGQVSLSNLPNNTLTITQYGGSGYSIVIGNTTQLISSDGQSFTVTSNQNYTSTSNPYYLMVWIGAIVPLKGHRLKRCLKRKNSENSFKGGEKQRT